MTTPLSELDAPPRRTRDGTRIGVSGDLTTEAGATPTDKKTYAVTKLPRSGFVQ